MMNDPATQQMLRSGHLSGGNMAPATSAEMLYIQQILAQERMVGTGDLPNNENSNLFLNTDSVIGKPEELRDTVSYVMILDTIRIDSLFFYNDIEEIRRTTPDGKSRIVLRRVKVPKEVKILRRYETTFFKNSNPAIFSGTTSGVTGNYPLKPGDELVLTIWGAVEKESKLTVNNQGMVNVESIGMVSLHGTTLAAAEGILRTRLSRVYSGINRGQTFVNLRLESLSPIKIFIVGEVEKPGAYIFHGNTTVFQALYMAGGPSAEGSVRSVQVTRQDSIFHIDLYDFLMHGRHSSRAILFDDDIVFLPRARILAEIDGAVGRPAIYELKEGEGVAELISFAGGINPDAAEQNMVLRRIFPNGRRDFKTILSPNSYIDGKDTLLLQNGDALMVFQSAEKSRQNATILGSIKYPGTYELKENMNVAELVEISGGLKEEGYSGRVHVLRVVPQGGYLLLSENLNEENSIALSPQDTLIVYSSKNMFRPDSVSIGGAVSRPGYFPYYEGMDAKDLVLMAGGYSTTSKKTILYISRLNDDQRTINKMAFSVPSSYDDKKDSEIKLFPWDHVEIPHDSNSYRPELVVLAGAFKNPGTYSLKHPDETIEQLLNRSGGFLDEAYIEGARFFRRTSMIAGGFEKSETFGLIGIDFPRALKRDKRHNVGLMDGDSIHIPQQAISVKVSGEVGAVTNVLWKSGAKISWYVSQAGGVKLSGDASRIMIRYADGSVSLASEAKREPDPGSEIIVPYKQPPEPVVWTQVVSAVSTIVQAAATLMVPLVMYMTAK
jgi:protein involved in polysaccharide export with SLBB domain